MGSTKKPPDSASACVSHVPPGQSCGLTAKQSKDVCSIREGINVTRRTGMLQGTCEIIPAPQRRQSPALYSPVQRSSTYLISTQLLLAMTYLTEREKSPGALSLSLIRKAPSCLCLPNISSAFARGIFPKNHLCGKEKKTIGKVMNFNPFMEQTGTPQLWKEDPVYALPQVQSAFCI